ncbi:HypC/HybG/HupF family hydrogenase formation chaperone [Pontiellaceae bacterium B12227]|nr:HypC/HybG/HupF family hydrogenase formation chaperone [Pontiellaceae bacterium B12227]
MCLAMPAKVLSIAGTTAEMDMGGNRIQADVSLVPEVKVDEYVMVHAGFALQIYDEAEALATLELFNEYAESLKADSK